MEARAKAILLGPRLLRSHSSTPPSPPSPAAGPCGSPWGACSRSSTTCCCSTSRRTISTCSASSGSRSSSAPTPAILITCHDRDFLDRVITKTFELDLGKLYSYTGNYSAHIPQKEHRLAVHQASFDSQQKKFQPDAGLRRSQPRQRLDRVAGAVPAEGDREDGPDRRPADRHLHAADSSFPSRREAASSWRSLRDSAFAYGTKVVYRRSRPGDRAGRQGRAGRPQRAGKTTLMKLLAGILDPHRGARTLGSNVFPTYFAQHRVEALDLRSTRPVEPPRSPSRARAKGCFGTCSGAFLFRARPSTSRSRALSGGEKTRLCLREDPHRRPQLHHDGRADEPPRHRQPRRARRGPSSYQGSLCFISHDEHFIRAVANKVIEVESGQLTVYPCDYESYLYMKLKRGIQDADSPFSFLTRGLRQRKDGGDSKPEETGGKKRPASSVA